MADKHTSHKFKRKRKYLRPPLKVRVPLMVICFNEAYYYRVLVCGPGKVCQTLILQKDSRVYRQLTPSIKVMDQIPSCYTCLVPLNSLRLHGCWGEENLTWPLCEKEKQFCMRTFSTADFLLLTPSVTLHMFHLFRPFISLEALIGQLDLQLYFICFYKPSESILFCKPLL